MHPWVSNEAKVNIFQCCRLSLLNRSPSFFKVFNVSCSWDRLIPLCQPELSDLSAWESNINFFVHNLDRDKGPDVFCGICGCCHYPLELSLISWDSCKLLLLPLSACHDPWTYLNAWRTILSPLSSFSSLMNSRCAKVFERPYTWLAIWQPSSLLWSTSPICNCSVFLIHTCFLASVLWAFDSSSVLAFLDELYRKLLTCCFWVLQQY